MLTADNNSGASACSRLDSKEESDSSRQCYLDLDHLNTGPPAVFEKDDDEWDRGDDDDLDHDDDDDDDDEEDLDEFEDDDELADDEDDALRHQYVGLAALS